MGAPVLRSAPSCRLDAHDANRSSARYILSMPKFGTFFLPGPTEVRPEILATLNRPLIEHRSAEFETMYSHIQAGLSDALLTARPVYLSTSSATGLMEMAVRNTPPGAILSLVNGAFSE